MKAGWGKAKLSDLCEFFGDGDWIETKDQATSGVRLIQTGNVGEGIFKDRGEKARYVSEATFKRLRCTEIFAGDCLISRLPDPVGRSCLLPEVQERMITAVDCTIVRFRLGELLPEFFNFYSQSPDYLDSVDAATTGTTRKRISRGNLGGIEVPVPAVVEQRRIVAILDEAFASIAIARANAEKNLQNARELFESELEAIFSAAKAMWSLKPVAQVGEVQTGSTPKTSERTNYGDFISFIKPGDFRRDGTLEYSNERLSKVGLSKARKVRSGSVLMVCIGATIGKCGYTEQDVTTNQQINALSPITDVSAKFVYFQMLTAEFQQAVRSNAGQATLPIINKGKWSSLLLSIPDSLDEQVRVVGRLEECLAQAQNLESIYRRKLSALDELKQSLLHQAFSGAL